MAELARGYLLAHGIDSVLQDVEFTTLEGPLSSLAGIRDVSVKLQVWEPDVPQAVRVLEEWQAAIARSHGRGGAADERCLACGAPLTPQDTRCAACGWTWEEVAPK